MTPPPTLARVRPIIFSGPMVRAMLAGRKTQDRTLIKPQPEPWRDFHLEGGCQTSDWAFETGWRTEDGLRHRFGLWMRSAFHADRFQTLGYEPGGLLWVREAFVCGWPVDNGDLQDTDDDGNELPMRIWYRADGDLGNWLNDETGWSDKTPPWRPSIHMPRWASRITLEVEAVRVERLQEIGGDDAIAEGVDPAPHRCGCERCALTSELCPATASSIIEDFGHLWDSIHGAGAWAANPWVAALTFRVHRCNVDALANR